MGEVTIEIFNIGLENLADKINKSFIYVHEKMSGFEARMDRFEMDLSEFKKETRGSLYELDRHARIANERLIGLDERLEMLEGKTDMILFEVRDHDRRIFALENR